MKPAKLEVASISHVKKFFEALPKTAARYGATEGLETAEFGTKENLHLKLPYRLDNHVALWKYGELRISLLD
jgi:hypothetical protein